MHRAKNLGEQISRGMPLNHDHLFKGSLSSPISLAG